MSAALTYFMILLSAASLGIFLVMYAYFKYSYSYWKKKGVAYLEPTFPFGNLTDALFQRKSGGETFRDIYKRLEGNSIGGAFAFSRPTLIVRDPEIIKTILVKDFVHFHDHGTYFNEEGDPLSAHLFNLTGARWKNLRTKLSPTFTSGKMKMMFEVLVDCGNELRTHVDQPAANGEALEIKDILAKFSTDIIASVAFGVKCNCLKDPDAEFRKWGRKTFETNIRTGIRDIVTFVAPSIAAILKIPFVPRNVTRYFMKMVKETVEYRENNNLTRNDFIQLLIQLKNKGIIDTEKETNGKTLPENGKDVGLTMNEVAAQAFVFFVAGFETSSTTMSFCLYELALNPDIQERVQKEIDAVLKKHGNKITYEAIQEMEYLDNAVSETLRKYPPVPFLTRECTKKYTIPGTNVTLEEGMSVVIPIAGMQKDPKYFPNPEKFEPDRFKDEVKNKRHHFTYLPFGEGPRICIGMRFGLLQTKVGLASLLSKNTFQVCEKTPVPMKLDKKTIITAADGGMWLKIVKRA